MRLIIKDGTAPPSIHGHEVLHFMLENESGFTPQSLKTVIEQGFGVDARFHTCNAEGTGAEQLIDF